MSADIAALKALALVAADFGPGDWAACGPSFGAAKPAFLDEVVALEDGEEYHRVCLAPDWSEEYFAERSANMEFIAAANPAAILALIERLEAAEAAPLPAEQPSKPVPLTDEHRRARKAIQDVIAQLQVLHEGRDPIMAAIITTVALLVDDDLQTVADFLGADTGARIVGQQTKGGGNAS